jgi:hypothetical protein
MERGWRDMALGKPDVEIVATVAFENNASRRFEI